jgi:hypothetical protein
MMIALKIGEECRGCGCCEELLPGLRKEVLAHGRLLLNTENPATDLKALLKALVYCDPRALTVEALDCGS